MAMAKPLLYTAALLALALHVSPAHALLARTFLSANGLDGNDCSRPSPCRTLQVAHDKTNSGGEINMLDPAGYGKVIITKSISIVNDGVGSAGILVPAASTGITISGSPNEVINLRGLIIEGAGVGVNGILVGNAKSVTIENCVIRGLTGSGINFAPGGASSLAVSNTLVADNGLDGISVIPSVAAALKVVLNNVESLNNVRAGIIVLGNGGGPIDATVLGSIVSGNVGYGFYAGAIASGVATRLTVIRSAAVNNGTGAYAEGLNATLRIGESIITGNTTSWSATDSATLRSYQDNYIDGNLDGSPTPTAIVRK
jgi:hypothetical protein